MKTFPIAAVERTMKVQEVILRAVVGSYCGARQLRFWGFRIGAMRRWQRRYEEEGYDGLFDRRRQRPSPKRVPLETVEKVLRLYREQYFDHNVRHFVQSVREEHGITLSYTWIKTALQTAGLVARSRKRGAHRKRRPRRPLPGMLLHVGCFRHRLLVAQL